MVQNPDSIKDECIEKWGGILDARLKEFSNRFETWLNQIPEEYKETALILMQNMEYYSHQEANSWLEKLHGRLKERNPEITDDNTIYAFIKSDDGRSNSSNDYWTEYKIINSLNKNISYENIQAIEDDAWAYIENIVFIDDFSGSGDSFKTELNKYLDRLEQKNVYLITLCIMTDAMKKILMFSGENNFNVDFITASKQEKAFNRELFKDNKIAKRKIKQLSRDFNIPEKEILGWKKTQALVAFYNNTPNNTLGIMRYETAVYMPLFPRDDPPKPLWQQLKKKDDRKRANYKNKCIGVL